MSFPSPAADYEQPDLNLHKHIVKHPAATFYMRVVAPGFPQKGVHEGDLLVVDRSLKPKTGSLVIACKGPDFLVGEYLKKNGKRYLISASRKLLELNGDPQYEDIFIWGLVTHSIRNFEGTAQQIDADAKLYSSY